VCKRRSRRLSEKITSNRWLNLKLEGINRNKVAVGKRIFAAATVSLGRGGARSSVSSASKNPSGKKGKSGERKKHQRTASTTANEHRRGGRFYWSQFSLKCPLWGRRSLRLGRKTMPTPLMAHQHRSETITWGNHQWDPSKTKIGTKKKPEPTHLRISRY